MGFITKWVLEYQHSRQFHLSHLECLLWACLFQSWHWMFPTVSVAVHVVSVLDVPLDHYNSRCPWWGSFRQWRGHQAAVTEGSSGDRNFMLTPFWFPLIAGLLEVALFPFLYVLLLSCKSCSVLLKHVDGKVLTLTGYTCLNNFLLFSNSSFLGDYLFAPSACPFVLAFSFDQVVCILFTDSAFPASRLLEILS